MSQTKREDREDLEVLKKEFREAVEKRASQLGCHPREVSRETLGAIFHPRWVRRIGFVTLRDMCFPPEPSPFVACVSMDSWEVPEFISRRIKECADCFHREPHELTWSEFRRYINFRYGENDKGIAKDAITRAGGFNAIRDKFFPRLPTSETVVKVHTQQAAAANRRIGTEAARQKLGLDVFEQHAKKLFAKAFNIQVCCKPDRPTDLPKEIFNLALSDLHIGADIDARETGALSFGHVEESRRLAYITKEVVFYKKDRRRGTILKVMIIGDIINGLLHDHSDGAAIGEQMARAIHLLVQMLAVFGAHFDEVHVHIVAGNHDRNKARHFNRAVNDKWDSMLWPIAFGLRESLANKAKNVKFFLPKTPYLIYENFGQKIFATHSDTVITVGNPSKSLPTGSIKEQINRLNASLPDLEEIKVMVVGHVHDANHASLENGVDLFINSALCPPNPHAISIGAFEANCSQWLFVSDEEDVVKEARRLRVGYKQDKDESLDEIIKPFTEFDGLFT